MPRVEDPYILGVRWLLSQPRPLGWLTTCATGPLLVREAFAASLEISQAAQPANKRAQPRSGLAGCSLSSSPVPGPRDPRPLGPAWPSAGHHPVTAKPYRPYNSAPAKTITVFASTAIQAFTRRDIPRVHHLRANGSASDLSNVRWKR